MGCRRISGRCRPSVIGREREVDPAEAVELGREIACTTIEVLQRVGRIDAEIGGSAGINWQKPMAPTGLIAALENPLSCFTSDWKRMRQVVGVSPTFTTPGCVS